MPVQSGAPSRATSPSKKSKKATGPNKGRKSNAAKSFKADGTPKKRWSAAERADRGHQKRRSGGAPNRAERRRQQFGHRSVSGFGDNTSRVNTSRDGDNRTRTETSRGRSDNAGRDDRRSESRRTDDRRVDNRRSDDRRSDDRRSNNWRSDDRRTDSWRSDDRRSDSRRSDDRRSNNWRSDDRRTDNRRSDDRRTDNWRSDDRRNDSRRTDDRRSDDRRTDNWRSDDRRSDDRRSDDRPRYDRTRAEHPRQTRSERPRREYGDDRSFGTNTESSADNMSWEAREVAPVDTGRVTEQHGFAQLGLPKKLVASLLAQGITDPFPIQAATIPDALAGRDVLGRGQTGSGKTLGFALPMLTTLGGPAHGQRTPRGVVLVPTRELAMQVADVIAPLAKTLDLSVTLIAGGMAYGPQIKAFDRGVDVVVATPGRLIDLMEQGVVDLTQVEVAVLDEADHMADLGFMPAVTTIMDQMPAGGQRLLFSATLDRAVDRLVKKYLDNPITHEVDSGQATVTTMEHHVVHVLPHDKNALTAEIAGRPGRTLIFVRTQRGADRVAEQLRAAGVMAGALHGGLTQGARTRILAAFKDGGVPVLVATDVAARGIHVDEIGLVLQVDPPAGPKDYLHRAGRTARAGGTGVVVTLALPHQRKEMYRLTSQAGVKSAPLEARPGDEKLAATTGARRPAGSAVSEADYQRLIAPPARGGGRPRNRKDHGRRDAGGYRGGNKRGHGKRSYA